MKLHFILILLSSTLNESERGQGRKCRCRSASNARRDPESRENGVAEKKGLHCPLSLSAYVNLTAKLHFRLLRGLVRATPTLAHELIDKYPATNNLSQPALVYKPSYHSLGLSTSLFSLECLTD